MRSPASLEGANTQRMHVQPPGYLAAHCERARAPGAQIVMEPEDQFYGDVSYSALDLEGHSWTFSTHVLEVSKAEAEEALGAPIRRAALGAAATTGRACS